MADFGFRAKPPCVNLCGAIEDMAKRHIELRVRTEADSEELVGELSDMGLLGAAEADGEIRLYWPEEAWHPAILDTVKVWLSAHEPRVSDGTLALEWVEDRDWNVSWMQSLRPVRIGRRLLIRQSWNPAEVPDGLIELVIDPKRAFGSGYHATTQLLLEWLEEGWCSGQRVLDVGTGSGVLAMAALRFGAACALGIDSDAEAVECARENAAANGFGPELAWVVGTAGALRCASFDCVLANLDRNALIRDPGGLTALVRPDGRMLLSGLLTEDLDDISRAFSSAGGKVGGHREKAGWIALEVRRCGVCS
jgi:ribosomal protein L11 methyltransferase